MTHLMTMPSCLMLTRARVCSSDGRTNLAAALRTVRTDVFASRRGARDSTVAKLVVVVTRAPSMNETETVAEARRLRADGVDIVGVGVGDAVSRSELDGVVSYPMDRNALYVDDYSQLSSYVSRLVSIQCNGTLDPPRLLTPPLTYHSYSGNLRTPPRT